MTSDEAKSAIDAFQSACESIGEVSTKAHSSKQSISGRNNYAERFRRCLVTMEAVQHKFNQVLGEISLPTQERETLEKALLSLKSSIAGDRTHSAHEVRRICQGHLLPRVEELTASPTPVTEQVLPSAVVPSSRGYLIRVVAQMNGCYEHQWYDACSVMVRRFVETLIIEVYEHRGKEQEIKKDGDYMMLNALLNAIINDTSFNLSRDTKKCLPLIKQIGDRSAHNRRYVSTKADIETIIPGLRVVADDLLHLAGLK